MEFCVIFFKNLVRNPDFYPKMIRIYPEFDSKGPKSRLLPENDPNLLRVLFENINLPLTIKWANGNYAVISVSPYYNIHHQKGYKV